LDCTEDLSGAGVLRVAQNDPLKGKSNNKGKGKNKSESRSKGKSNDPTLTKGWLGLRGTLHRSANPHLLTAAVWGTRSKRKFNNTKS
jgi:hypothetical protein